MCVSGAVLRAAQPAGSLVDTPVLPFAVKQQDVQKQHITLAQVGQRRYVLLFLWMANQGGGVVPGKTLANAARRLRVTCGPLPDIASDACAGVCMAGVLLS